jgi:hypothetical protein
MRRLLRFGCITVIAVVVIAAIAAAFGSQRTQTGQRPQAIENTALPKATAPPAQEPTATAVPPPAPGLAMEYMRPDERSGSHAGFVVRFMNATNDDVQNPQVRVIVELGGRKWTCQGYGDPTSGAPVTGVGGVVGSPLVIPAGQEMIVTI